MPIYELPKPSEDKKDSACEPVCGDDISWMRRVHGIPANEELVSAVTVGEEFVVVLRGTVEGADLRKHADGEPTGGLDLNVDSVEVYPPESNEISKLVDDE